MSRSSTRWAQCFPGRRPKSRSSSLIRCSMSKGSRSLSTKATALAKSRPAPPIAGLSTMGEASNSPNSSSSRAIAASTTPAGRPCRPCARLVAFREACRVEQPAWWNAPVPAFGDREAWLAIVGLAPGKHGANRTGRPFTGDFAGDLLYATLLRFGLAEGEYRADPHDGLQLKGTVILNAVKSLPPANKLE